MISTSAWFTLAILGSTILITLYGETMLLPAIRDIIRDFNISYSTSSWILTAYLISGAVATPIAAKLSDIYGRKKMVVIILIIYIIGICAGGFSTNISFLLVARVIEGIEEKEGNLIQAEANIESNTGHPPSPGGDGANSSRRQNLDVKGAITLAVTIASFLLTLTYIGNGSNNNSSSNVSINSTQIIV